ncbi:DUF2290 domain-containing protein [Aeromicrobium sp.]|uniref:DUF2290 domain-containing protein n=1 Tax=Aeromicrobium sp. TaxID=1871063 RepID=UPI0034231F34
MPATSARAVRDDIQNALDYLLDADLCLATNPVDVVRTGRSRKGVPVERVRFISQVRDEAFLISHGHPGIDQYLAWVRAGSYSAVLFDGSLLQFTYDITTRGEVVGHRLAYMPCPYDIEPGLFAQESLLDAIDLYEGSEDILMRSQLRFDYDPEASSANHPAAHFTINSSHCRIACVAPIHVLRFLDFIFRHAYPTQRRFHSPFFAPAAWRHIGEPVLSDDNRSLPHLTWDVRSRMSSVT